MFILMVQPLALPIWLAGLAFFFLSTQGRTYRVLGWIYFTVLAIFSHQYQLETVLCCSRLPDAVARRRGRRREVPHSLPVGLGQARLSGSAGPGARSLRRWFYRCCRWKPCSSMRILSASILGLVIEAMI